MPKRNVTADSVDAVSPRKLKKSSGPNSSPVKTRQTSLSKNQNSVEIEDSAKHPEGTKDVGGFLATKIKFFDQFSSVLIVGESDFSYSDVRDEFRSLYNALDDEEIGEKRILVDQLMRDYFLDSVLSCKDKWTMFLELSIQLAREEISTASLPIALITDLVELSNLQDCEVVFEFVEQRLEVWKEPFFLNSGKNVVLRMCNDLLRRHSRAQNTIFCGRILIFLANYFPFSERSGLNIMSEFNSDNITTYKTGDGSDDPEDKMEVTEDMDDKLFEGMDVSIPGLDKIVSLTQEEKKNRLKVDYNLYVKFWSLQDFFRNPNQCYNKIAWKTFTMYTQDVLLAFSYFKLEDVPYVIRQERLEKDLTTLTTIPKLGDEKLYFAKYLTNRRLLELQMGDPSFRRYFLVQIIIILQYLTLSVKFKTENQSLSEEQHEYVRKATDKIYELMAEIPPNGPQFVHSIQHIMKREELWNKWKNDGCQPFKKPIVSAIIASDTIDNKDEKAEGDEDKDKKPNAVCGRSGDELGSQLEEAINKKAKKKIRKELGEVLQDAYSNNRYDLGNSELSRLWNICPNNLEACRSKGRDFMPPIESFFVDAMKELDPEPTPPAIILDPSKREVKPKKILGNANFGWRALRLLARRSPYFFQMFGGSPIHPLQNYLEFVLKKIAIDMETPVIKEDIEDEASGKPMEPKHSSEAPVENDNEDGDAPVEGDQVMEGGADDDEILRPDGKGDSESGEEEGEVSENVRNLTEDEQTALGKGLGIEWKQVAPKLGFTKDEIQFFMDEHKEGAGAYMLKLWTEQEKEDATVADLLYILEGLKLKHLVEQVIG